MKKVRRLPVIVIITTIFIVGGLAYMHLSSATTNTTSLEAENGTVQLGAVTVEDGSASGGEAVRFGSSAGRYNPTQEWSYTGSYPWNFSHVHGPKPVVVDSPHPNFPKAAKFTINDSSRASFDGGDVRRSEMVHGDPHKIGNPTNGLVQWWAGTFWLPTNFVAPTYNPKTGGWLFPLQFHAKGNGKPLVLNFPTGANPARLQLVAQSHKYDLGAIPTNIQQTIGGTPSNRVDWKMKVLWHESSSTGRVSFWVNGVQKVNNQPAQTLIPGEYNYLKQGLYGNRYKSGTTPEPQQIIFDTGLRYGPTEASITL